MKEGMKMLRNVGITMIVTGVMMTAKGVVGLVKIRRNIKRMDEEFKKNLDNNLETGGMTNV